MTTSSAENRNNYALEDAGSTHIFGGKGNTGVTITSVRYGAATDSAKLTLAKPVPTSDSLRLTINAQPPKGLQGANGQFLNEAANGKPGANYVTYLGAPRKTPPPPKPPNTPVILLLLLLLILFLILIFILLFLLCESRSSYRQPKSVLVSQRRPRLSSLRTSLTPSTIALALATAT
jgi:hypothetical protein